MPVTITNLTSGPILVPLNTGGNVRISPGATVSDVRDVDVKDNSKVNKLLSRRAISVGAMAAVPVSKKSSAATKSDTGTDTPATKKT